ncbi:type I restriction endonuclease subunit S [Saccharobesus litoralis]|uniref:Type I restriction endonuclease subunit S n=1 Tax=Saccharobesus litoralis TaxID=2172099 RepID=A0A2S0VMB5_9ALTE|nr:restriction endonuclease subunit S [Saccharobesus litoralis]AWB65319.1 type I restriction endonuclease subunit S [Saccharobesus litoralis]
MSQLPRGWEFIQLKELIILNKKFKDLEDDLDCGFVPMANVPTKLNEKLTYESRKWGDCKKGFTHFQNGDVLLAKITPCFENGKSVLVTDLPNGIGAGSTEYFVMRPNGIDSRYLHAFVKTKEFVDSCKVHMSGSVGHKRVPKDYLLNYMVPVAPENDQKRIADKLDSILAKVEAAQARLDKIPTILKRFRQSVLAAATSGELTKDWREENDFEFPRLDDIDSYWKEQFLKQNRKFKSYTSHTEDTNDIGWLPSKLGSICDVHVGSTPKRTEPSYWNGDVKWVSSSEVAFCEIFDTKETITIKGLENSSTKLHPSGTVMLAMIGQGKTRGQPAILRTEACHNQNTAALRIPEYHLLPEYLYYLLWERYEETRKIGAGNNQKALNKATVQSIDINLPPLDEQKIIVQKVEQLFEQAGTVEKQYNAAKARLDKLTQSILAKAFRGELLSNDTLNVENEINQSKVEVSL